MKQSRPLKILALLLMLSLAVMLACGGSDDATNTLEPITEQAPVEAPTDTPVPATNTPEPAPTNTPQPAPTDTPQPAPTNTPVPETNDAPAAGSGKDVQPATDTLPSDPQMEAYQHPQNFFVAAVPEGWELVEDESSMGATSEALQAAFFVQVTPTDMVIPSDQLIDYGTGFLQAFLEGEDLTINDSWTENDDSIGIDFTVTSDDKVREGIFYVEQFGLDMYHILMASDADAWGDAKPYFEAFLSAYQATPTEATPLSEALVLTPYTDPTELFNVELPVDWAFDTDDGSVSALSPNGRASVEIAAAEMGMTLTGKNVEEFSNELLTSIYDDYEVILNEVETQPNSSFGLDFDLKDADGDLVLAYGNIRQLEEITYLIIFQAYEQDWTGLSDTYLAVAETYNPMPVAAPPAEPPTPTPLPPTPTPEASSSSDIPAEWFPPAGQATIVLVNEAGADLVFTMDNQEHKLVANTEKVATFNPGTFTYTASDPRFESYNSECTVVADHIYYWYTNDQSWGSCYQIYP